MKGILVEQNSAGCIKKMGTVTVSLTQSQNESERAKGVKGRMVEREMLIQNSYGSLKSE